MVVFRSDLSRSFIDILFASIVTLSTSCSACRFSKFSGSQP